MYFCIWQIPFNWYVPLTGFSGGSDSKESACNVGDLGSSPGLGRSPWRRKWLPTPVFLPGKSPWTEKPGELHGPWGRKESDTTKRLSTDHHQFSSVQFSHSVVSNSLQPHETQHARPPCPSPAPGVHPNPCPSSW